MLQVHPRPSLSYCPALSAPLQSVTMEQRISLESVQVYNYSKGQSDDFSLQFASSYLSTLLPPRCSTL